MAGVWRRAHLLLWATSFACTQAEPPGEPAPGAERSADVGPARVDPPSISPSISPTSRPGPQRGRGALAVEQNRACVSCHPSEAREWVVWLAGGNVLLQVEAGKVTPLPPVPGKKPSVFLSSERVLHASDGQSIHRFEEGAWRKVADLAWSFPPGQLAIGGGEMWAVANRKLHRLQPAPSLAVGEGCATPFVWLYDVAAISEPSFTFPTTRKALASFDEVDRLTLVDFNEGVRRLGVTVPSREVGEAVIAHLKETMKDEQPRLVCYRPKGERTIPIGKPTSK